MLARLNAIAELAHPAAQSSPIKSQIAAHFGLESRHEALVANLVPLEPSQALRGVCEAHHRAIKRGRTRQSQKLVHRRIHLEAAPEAVQDHVARIAYRE